MKKTFSSSSIFIILAVPLAIIGFSVLLAFSSLLRSEPALAIGITYDLVLTAPLAYFLLIRKRNIPNITVIPVFILGIVITSFVLPEGHRSHLEFIKTFILPMVELTVVSLIIYKSVHAVKAIKANAAESGDFYVSLQESAYTIVKNKRIANLLATEIGAFYYSFFTWKRKKCDDNQFTTYRKSGITATYGVVIFLVLIETVALHLLLVQWIPVIAWILFGLSLYTAIQLFGHLKALRQRHHEISSDSLVLKNGLFGDAEIELVNIEKIEATRKNVNPENSRVEKLGFLKELESHNMAIYLKSPTPVKKAYGVTKSCDILLFHTDDTAEFLRKLNDQVNLAG